MENLVVRGYLAVIIIVKSSATMECVLHVHIPASVHVFVEKRNQNDPVLNQHGVAKRCVVSHTLAVIISVNKNVILVLVANVRELEKEVVLVERHLLCSHAQRMYLPVKTLVCCR